ncbi:lysophospholipid acyltransferase family protein [Candidatus Magnetomonas plexicatena]|uniref:lysophospholipid acyltransferase family protein n=1 Tax=Candidatus Magnetomonas plexicatena TaxID=2552947 RepID=UPI001C7867E7|nr:lauroyl acyltransferase [Nitrospirales bacterium LBB_01]
MSLKVEVVKDIFRFVYYYPFRYLVGLLPFSLSYRLIKALGSIGFKIDKKKEFAYSKEVKRLFPNIPDEEVRNIAKETLLNFLQNEIETLMFPNINKDNIDLFIEYVGLENLDIALKQGCGVILLFAHFGANQMVMPAIGYKGYKMSQLGAPATVWNDKDDVSYIKRKNMEIKWRHEQTLPVTHINVFGSLKEAFLCLKRNEILGVAIDGGGGKDWVEVEFFDKRALYSTGAIDIALRTNAVILPVFMVRGHNSRHTMIIEQPLVCPEGADKTETITNYTAAFVSRLESYVAKYPWHYMYYLAWRSKIALNGGDVPYFKKEDTLLAKQKG